MRRAMFIVGLSIAAAGCAVVGRDAEPGRPFSVAVERGERFAQRACAGCHVIRGDERSRGNAPTFQTLRLRYTGPQLERRLAEISGHGHYEMSPIYISPDEAKDLAEYVESLGSR